VRRTRLLVPVVLASLATSGLGLSALGASTATAAVTVNTLRDPQLRLFSPDHSPVMTIHNSGPDQWIDFNPAMYLETRKDRFEIDVRRRSAEQPIRATVQIGGHTRTIPGKLLDGWRGLKDAFTITWLTPSGTQIARSRAPWCPNDGQPSRLGPHSATETVFTYGCSTQPFTRGTRWGIDRGWARQVLAYGISAPANLTGSQAVMEVKLRTALADIFNISASEQTIRFHVTINHVTDAPGGGPVPTPVPGNASHAAPGSLDGASLPDLIALPAFGMSTHVENGRDLLDFAATVYNGGQGPLVAEGFRRGSKRVMDAYQFFYSGDKQVAYRRVGTMEYDARPTHMHWHFRDFAVYDLVNRQQKRLRTSGKEAFCLAPTDAINLLQRGAVVNPGNGDLSTACGDVSSVWVREVLASGWGDTYTQQRAGQSIDITGLPNGSYWVRVTANPVNRLHETTRSNNVSLRHVILGGTAGHRTVKVPNYGLINSEAQFANPGGPGGFPID
jgi:hypothetical protein